MDGKETLIVLGAGASFCYEDGPAPIPMQNTLLNSMLFKGDTTPASVGFPTVVGPVGMSHSFGLAEWIRGRFGLPERETPNSKTDYWGRLHQLGFTLESLYGVVESEAKEPGLVEDFEAIVRTAVTEPCGDREEAKSCRHYRALVERLEPGDCILSFNWDPLLPDALLRYSHFWFPTTGFGIVGVTPLVNDTQKSLPVISEVFLLPIHGSVSLYEMIEEDESKAGRFVFLGPQTWNSLSSMIDLARQRSGNVEKERADFGTLTPSEEDRFAHGWLYFRDRWFKPLFVPPTRTKGVFAIRFSAAIKRLVYQVLLRVRHIAIAGYSFPPADMSYVQALFLKDLISSKTTISVINPENENPEFRDKVEQVFHRQDIDYSQRDFRAFCKGADRR
jgi:hypothetical protein